MRDHEVDRRYAGRIRRCSGRRKAEPRSDGRTVPERRVLIKPISLGSQTVNNVLTGGRADNGMSLLGMGVLKWFRRFTIDTATDRLIPADDPMGDDMDA